MTTVDTPRIIGDGPTHRGKDGDHDWYDHPLTGERFLSVTSALDYRDKSVLREVYTPGLAARYALDNLPKLIRATRLAPCGRTNSRCRTGEDAHDWRVRCAECPCGECPDCVFKTMRDQHWAEKQRHTERGSNVHHWLKRWILSGGTEPVDTAGEVGDYVRSFLTFVADFGLTADSWQMAEVTVINRKHGYAGTLDGAIRFDATKGKARELCEIFGLRQPTVLMDLKTREKTERAFYTENALQLTAYERGETLMLDDGTELPMPRVDGAIVVQVHQEGYHWQPMATTDEEFEDGFLSLVRHARWSLRRGSAVASAWHQQRDEYGRVVTGEDGKPVRVTSFPRREIPGLEPERKPAKKAAPRKATSERAGTAPPAKSTGKRAPAKTAGKAEPLVQPSLPEPAQPSKLEQVTLTGAARSFAAHGQRAPHPDSPYGDDIPF